MQPPVADDLTCLVDRGRANDLPAELDGNAMIEIVALAILVEPVVADNLALRIDSLREPVERKRSRFA